MKTRQVLFTVVVAVLSSFLTLAAYQQFYGNGKIVKVEHAVPSTQVDQVYSQSITDQVDFTTAASNTTAAVVHIKSKTTTQTAAAPRDLFEFFYGGPQQPMQEREALSSGSGVIISEDGYIVTNNHVIAKANEIEVTLHDKQTFTAELVGTDKDTDLALLKIESDHLFPKITLTNSDQIKVGEWVLAVGNPFNLASTVTAGIVSAKGRNINILKSGDRRSGNTAIESFIQTDAAVNPGNSGGALVNMRGELVGINTAIATPTGSFAGYSFAVPSNIVAKVITDLKEFGAVQRGFLGVSIRNVDKELAESLQLPDLNGVVLNNIREESAADEAGLKENDVVKRINGVDINSSAALQEQVAQYRPGDKIEVEFMRDGESYQAEVTLKNKFNTTAVIEQADDILKTLGVKVANVDANTRQKLRIRGGVRVIELENGTLRNYTNVKRGFIITHIDDEPVANVSNFKELINRKKGNVMIEGVYPDKAANSYLYAFKL